MSITTQKIQGETYEVRLTAPWPRNTQGYDVSVTKRGSGLGRGHVGNFHVAGNSAVGFTVTVAGQTFKDKIRSLVVNHAARVLVEARIGQALKIAQHPGDNVLVALRNVPGYHVTEGWTQIVYSHAGQQSLYLLKSHNPDQALQAVKDMLATPVEDGAGYRDGKPVDGREPEYALFTNIHDALRYLNEGTSEKDIDNLPISDYEVKATILGTVLFREHPDQHALLAEAKRRADEIHTKAAQLLALLDCDQEGTYVPSSTGHFAVEGAKKALRALVSNPVPAEHLIAGVK